MSVFKKERLYKGVTDVQKMVDEFVNYLKNQGYKVQEKVEGNYALVQAQKGGILRDIIAAERALTFKFEKTSDGVKVTAGIGKWLQNIAVTALEVLFLSEIFLFVDVPEMLWNEHVESNMMKKLDEIAKGQAV